MTGEYKFVLEGQTPMPERDIKRWANWFETADRQVALSEIGSVQISTIFLGLNHNFFSELPVLFETMVFGGQLDGLAHRYYSTWDEAVAGHAEVVTLVEGAECTITGR